MGQTGVTSEADTPAAHQAGQSLWKDAWLRLRKNRMAVISLGILIAEALICAFTPLIAPYGFETQTLENTLAAPSLQHWFGTDALGTRSFYARTVRGGRISLAVGILASLVSVVVGVIYGATAGFMGRRMDSILMRVVDVLYAVPFIFLVIILMVFFGRNIFLLFRGFGIYSVADDGAHRARASDYAQTKRVCRGRKIDGYEHRPSSCATWCPILWAR
jgi:oligopeptide transport system permease protein